MTCNPIPTDMNEIPETAAGESPEPKYRTFSEALHSARKDAACMARDAAPKLKQALQGAAHDMAYGAAFGACFAACFAKELLPTGVRDAFRRGADAGSKAAKEAAADAADPTPALPA